MLLIFLLHVIDFFKCRSSCNHISVSRFKCSCYSKYNHPNGPSMLEFRAEQSKDIVDAIYHVRQKLQERAKGGKERFDFKVSHESVKKRNPRRKYVGGHHKKDYSHARLIKQKRNFTAMESSRCDDNCCDQQSGCYSCHNNTNLKSFNHHEKRYRCEDKRSKHESRLHKSESIS